MLFQKIYFLYLHLLIKEVWLVKENITKLYKELGRVNPKESYKIVLEQLEKCEFSQKWLKEFQQDMKESMTKKQKENIQLPIQDSYEILQALKEVDKMLEKNIKLEQEVMLEG